MIKVLEEQLLAERQRREALTTKFREQITEFEQEREALERIRRASNLLEKKQLERQHTSHVSISQSAVNQSSATTELDLVPTKESYRSKVSSQASKKKIAGSYRPERVKTSIPSFQKPKANPAKQPIHIPTISEQQDFI
jgi:hypothetical protein